MKKNKLDKEEKAILRAYENGKLKSVSNVKKEIARYRTYAQASLEKKKINVELTGRALFRLKKKAADQGTSYQRLASSVLHQYSDR